MHEQPGCAGELKNDGRGASQIPPLPPLKVVISGPSGVGKDAVIKALQASRPNLHFVVTATSRSAPLSIWVAICTSHLLLLCGIVMVLDGQQPCFWDAMIIAHPHCKPTC